MTGQTLERRYEGRTIAGARRQQQADGRRLADEGYRVVDETAYVVNPEAPRSQRVERLVTIYQVDIPEAPTT